MCYDLSSLFMTSTLQPKIAVFMWYDSKISFFADINYKINKAYCDKHNIEIICCNQRRYDDRPPVWERIPLILHYIDNYDYAIWIDADAHFYIDGENIVDLIAKYSNYNFIFSNDIPKSIKEGILVSINTGFFIVKNTKYSIDFLHKWGYDDLLCKNNRFPKWPDQGVVLDMYKDNMLDIQNNSVVFDYGILQHFHDNDVFTQKPFVFHLAGRNETIRYNHSLRYFTENIP